MISEAYNMDCMEAMKQFPDKYFELAIVDPPYGIDAGNMQMGSAPTRKGNNQYPGESTAVKLKKGRLNTSKIDWDCEKPSAEYFAELKRVSINQIIFGGNYFDLGPTRCVICWNKMQPWENFSQWEMGWTSFDKPAALFSYSNTGGANLETKIHPTQKPIALYKWLLKHYANEGDKILDTHIGSGSSRIACYDMGFDFYGTELDADYFKAMEERFFNHTAQGRLFYK